MSLGHFLDISNFSALCSCINGIEYSVNSLAASVLVVSSSPYPKSMLVSSWNYF